MGTIERLQTLIERKAVGAILRTRLKVLGCPLKPGRSVGAARIAVSIRAGVAGIQQRLIRTSCATVPGSQRITALPVGRADRSIALVIPGCGCIATLAVSRANRRVALVVAGRGGVAALPVGIGQNIAALPVSRRQRVIALLQALIALLGSFLGVVITEKIKERNDSLPSNWCPQPGGCFEGQNLVVRRRGR